MTRLALRVAPGAKASGWAGVMPDGRRRIRISAPAIDGKANAALVRFVAKSLDLSPKAVRLAHGAGGRDKVVEVDLEPEELSRRLAACGAGKEME